MEEAAKGYNYALGENWLVPYDKLIKGIADIVRSDAALIKFLKEQIINSKTSYYSEKAQIAAANAITILVAANIPFFEEDLSAIRIRGANIRDGLFTNCDFTEADLTSVKMNNCKLQGANMKYATLKDIDLGVYPAIECPFPITGLKISTGRQGDYILMSVHKNDGKIIFWNLATHAKIEEFDGNAAAFSPDGLCFAIAKQKVIQLWKELEKGNFKFLRTMEGHTDLINLLEYTSDGCELISAAVDKNIKLWDAHSGTFVRNFQGHTDYITGISYCHQYNLIASSSCDKSVIIWSKETGKVVKKITDNHDVVNAVSFFEKGEKIVSASDESPSTLKVWLKNGFFDTSFEGYHYNGIKSVSVSKNGSLFVSVSKEKILVLDHHNKTAVMEIPMIGDDQIFAAIFNPDDTQIISGGTDKKISFTDCTNAGSRKIYEGPSIKSFITSLALSPCGSMIACGDNGNIIRLWNRSNGKLIRTFFGHHGEVSAVTFSQNGNNILSGSRDKTCILWKQNNGHKEEEFKTDNPVTAVAFAPQKENNFVCASGKVINLFTVNPKKLVVVGDAHTDIVTSVAYSQDGLWLVTGSLDRTVILWDSHAQVIRTFEGHTGVVYSVAFSPKDGSKIISAGGENNIKVWERENGNQMFDIQAHYYDINSIAYSPDEKYILSGSNDNKVKIFREEDGSCVKTLEGHNKQVTHVSFARDGSFVCSAGHDSVIRVWQKREKSENEADFCLALEIASEETALRCNDLVIHNVNDLSEFNKSVLNQNGAKGYLD